MAIYKGSTPMGINNIVEKKVYVEVPEGSTIDEMSENNTIAIQPEEYAALQDGITHRLGRPDQRTIQQMINDLKKDFYINRQPNLTVGPVSRTWVRPQDWPDLDSLNLTMEGDDFIYMTYGCYGTTAITFHIETANRQPATLDIGHITNGTYITDETYSINHNTNFVKWMDGYSGYLVLRVTGQIAQCSTYQVTRDGQTQTFRQCPILERIAWVPHLIRFCGSSQGWGTYFIERDKVANGDGTTLTSMYCAWSYARNLQDLDITGLRTPNVTNMDSAFCGTNFLYSLDLRHLDVSKVTTFTNMCYECRQLRTLDLTGWNTSNATTFTQMFYGCRSLYDLRGAWNFNTDKATNIAGMFNTCFSLPEIHVENYNVSNVTNINSIFNECHAITSLDLSNWRLTKVQIINSMFANCRNLKSINFNGWTTTGILTNISSLFSGCYSLKSVDISWLHVTNSCTSIGSLFYYCYSLEEINFPNDWDVSGLSSGNYTAYNMFTNCMCLKKITGIKNWNFQLSNSLSSMFSGCWSLEELDVSNWNVSTVTNLSSMFANCWSLKNLNISNWYAPNTTNVASMFDYCYSLEEIDITNLKPGAVTSMASMFRWCYNLRSFGNISDWDTSACTAFNNVFQDCESLKEFPNMSNWDFSAATTTNAMFQGCMSIKEITWDNLSLPNCTNVGSMFAYCYRLEKVHMIGWSIPKVTSTSASTFLGYCTSLKHITIDIPFTVNLSFYYDDCLTHQSCLNIINSLPTVATKRTLALMNSNINRLTAAEKLIITNKNWTLSNS